MLQLLFHLVGLLIQLLDFELPGPNISLQLFDLIIKHELKLLKLLRFLFKIINPLIFILDGSLSFLQLPLLRLDLLPQVISKSY